MLRFLALTLLAIGFLNGELTDYPIAKKAVYCTAGVALESASRVARFGWRVCLLTPWASTYGQECLYVSELLSDASRSCFSQLSKQLEASSTKVWKENQMQLLEIPAETQEERELLNFLSHHFLSKVSGFFSVWVNWLCPSFDAHVHVHPETTGFYARNPAIKFPEAYKNRVLAWKRSLPQPMEFPLILTRPFEVQEYLPSGLIDVTALLEGAVSTQEWLASWERIRADVLKERERKPLFCIQRISSETIGGIRVLPLDPKHADIDHAFLLDWISAYGLSATRIELDRWPTSFSSTLLATSSAKPLSKEDFLARIKSFDSTHPQKRLMAQGFLQVLGGLFTSLSQTQWEETLRSHAKSKVAQLSLEKIEEQLEFLGNNEKELSFFELATRVELLHADLCALLEVFSPFTHADFPKIYAELMQWVPDSLKPLMSAALHSSGMTNMAGVFRAVEKMVGGKPRILYGENAYFELIHAAHLSGDAVSIEEAEAKDWEEADLLLAQFNPALKRINFKVTEYKLEEVALFLKLAFGPSRTKPLTLAIDCTFDYLSSSQIEKLLLEFQDKIESGQLNLVCYRSGIKYDAFGMDNYCGAPFMMLHNASAHWEPFSHLLTDEALQADILSLNWYCLAYKYAANSLESYRKQTFDNTQALLNALPKRLFETGVRYRVIPMQQEANLGFIDLKVYGPLHKLRASAVVGGTLAIECLKSGHPIFNRASVGFYHPNICILYAEECSTIRITLGLEPSQIAPLVKCFEKFDSLNL